MTTSRFFLVLTAVGLMIVPGIAAAGTCYLDDLGSLNGRISPIQAGNGAADDFGGTDLCHGPNSAGHEVHGSNCVLEVFLDSTGRNGSVTCLSIGKGVTVQMQGHTIDCANTDAPCGDAIKVTDSGGSGDKVQLNSGNITGCWDNGIVGNFGSNTNISDFLIDLTGGSNCTGNGNTGIGNSYIKTITLSAISNADVDCVMMQNGTIDYSIVHDCAIGIHVIPNSAGQSVLIDRVLAIDNGDNIKKTTSNSLVTTIRDSQLRNASGCNITKGSGCLTASTSDMVLDNVNFLDDLIVDNP